MRVSTKNTLANNPANRNIKLASLRLSKFVDVKVNAVVHIYIHWREIFRREITPFVSVPYFSDGSHGLFRIKMKMRPNKWISKVLNCANKHTMSKADKANITLAIRDPRLFI